MESLTPTFDIGIKKLLALLDGKETEPCEPAKITTNTTISIQKSTIIKKNSDTTILADITNTAGTSGSQLHKEDKAEFEAVLSQLLDSFAETPEESPLKPVNRKRAAVISSDEEESFNNRGKGKGVVHDFSQTPVARKRNSRTSKRAAVVESDSDGSDLELVSEKWVKTDRVPIVALPGKFTSTRNNRSAFKAPPCRTGNNSSLDTTALDLVTSDEEDLFSDGGEEAEEEYVQRSGGGLIEVEAQCDDDEDDDEIHMDGPLEESFVDDRTLLTQQVSPDSMQAVYMRSLQSQWR